MADLKSPNKPANEIKTEGKSPAKPAGDVKPKIEGERNSEGKNDRNNQHGGGDKGGRRGGYDGRRSGSRFHGGGRGGGGNFSRKRDESIDRSNQGQSFAASVEDSGSKEQKKFTGRCRLFVGNITADTTEEQFKDMFTPFGEVSEVFVNAARGFGFIRLDYRINAEKAKAALDGEMRNKRVLRVRFATHGAALKVTNISPYVSNELLEAAFTQFGEVERAVVVVDDRGRPTGEGLVEFARKPGATAALKAIQEGVFLLTAFPRPVHVELLEQKDEEDGLTEKFIQKTDAYRKDREKEPRFAPPGSFEFEFALKWRRIDEMEKERIERVKKEMDMERNRLEGEMETAMYDYQADQIRQDLLRQQEELKRLEEMKTEQMRRRAEMDIRRQDDRMRMSGEERHRQEMMMRAGGGGGRPDMRGGPDMVAMNAMAQQNREEMMRNQSLRDSPSGRSRNSGGAPGTPPMPPPPIPPGMNMEQGNRGQGFGGPGQGAGNMGPGNSPNQGNQAAQMQRQGQFEGQGGFRGGQGGNLIQGQGNMFPGNMRNNPNMNEGDRRRDRNAGGGNREDYENMKRMRRY